MKDLSAIASLLRCLQCGSDVSYSADTFECNKCGAGYPVVDAIPRFVPERFWNLNRCHDSIQEKTKNYFGFEWDYFKDWGFIEDHSVPDSASELYKGGRVSDRQSAFISKCRMTDDDLKKGNIVLDAGCGNGRYTYEAASKGSALVLGIDVGYGSVASAFENTRSMDNVIIMQCDLLHLPFKDRIFDGCFSNGVLMHTGDAEKAFKEISRTIRTNGVFTAHIYNRLNPLWEFNDYILRLVTTRLSISANLKIASCLAGLSRLVNKLPGGFKYINYLMRLQPSVIHMYDWYSAPIATHHTIDELNKWFLDNNFEVLDAIPKRGLWKHPWAINLKGQKKA